MLSKKEAPVEPLALFEEWLAAARAGGMFIPEAFALATVGEDGVPSVRMLLLKDFGPHGFTFYTNYGSPKAADLDHSGVASLLFWWRDVQRQVRVTGKVVRTDAATNAAYFETRPRGSKVGAWASRQSQEIDSREALNTRFDEAEARFPDSDVPCPEFWGGYCLVPDTVEFWQGQEDRLHDRLVYRRAGDGWTRVRLMP